MRSLATLALLLAATAAGCGGSGKTTPTATIPLQLSGIPHSHSCDKSGISTRGAAGTCMAGPTKIIVADKGDSLHMKEFAVQVIGIRTTAHLGNRAASNFGRNTKFVVVTLRVTNSGSKAQPFDETSQLAFLLVDGKEYAEVQGAEAELASSFYNTTRAVKPGGSATGTVVFDPPQKHAAHAGNAGSYLVVLNSEDSGNGVPRLGFRAIGFVPLEQ